MDNFFLGDEQQIKITKKVKILSGIDITASAFVLDIPMPNEGLVYKNGVTENYR